MEAASNVPDISGERIEEKNGARIILKTDGRAVFITNSFHLGFYKFPIGSTGNFSLNFRFTLHDQIGFFISTMTRKLLNIWRPEVYHGLGEKANFFEGWVYKRVDSSRKNILAVIPGVFISQNEQESHAFIQVLDGSTHRSHYQRFPLSQFQTASGQFHISIGPNSFSKHHLNLDLHDHPHLRGQLQFEQLQSWPVHWSSPGAMGWYAFVPFMECYHGILSLDHRIDGERRMDGQQINFENGRGYLEKDWGKSFPQAYIWMQCNHFEQPSISLTLSIAKIPWLKGSFRGFIIGFLFGDRLYRFTTYNGAELR